MIAQSKSILAKLLAKENIKVEHKKVQTAYFDLKARVLVCPIWQEMSSDLYDLLLGHEVSHALHTPEEGWHDEVTTHKGGFKTYLNIIEDARIERKIKTLYPGLKPSFSKAYQELSDREFFGPKYIIESDNLPLIDRMNLHFKIGPFANIQFDDYELQYVNRASELETWEEVVALAKELHELGKGEQKELTDKLNQLSQMFDESDWHEDEYGDFEDSPEQMEFESNEGGEDLEELQEILDNIKSSKTIGDDGTTTEEDQEEDPSSVTDRFFRSKESELLNAKCRPYYYADLPTPKLKDIVIPYKTILKHTNFKIAPRYIQDDNLPAEGSPEFLAYENAKAAMVKKITEDNYTKFMNNNKKYISYLVKEFELRKNAQQFARASIAKTGELDVKKVFSYKFNEDIFKRVTSIPGGKNHGMLMFLDFSGSMSPNIKATIEQTILLAVFCKKICVPFRVFSFSDTTSSEWSNLDESQKNKAYTDISNTNLKFSVNIGEVLFSNTYFFMAEYLSSDMSHSEFNTAIKNLLMLSKILSEFQYHMYDTDLCFDIMNVPHLLRVEDGHRLNGTPLNEAIVSSIQITEEFKKKYKLDIVNTIFLTDGDGASSSGVITEYYNRENYNDGSINTHVRTSSGIEDDSSNFIVRDKKTNTQGFSPAGCPTTVAYLDMLSKLTGANVIGFYLMYKPTPGRLAQFSRNYGKYLSDIEQSVSAKSIRQHKYVQLDIPGYKKMFVLPNGKDLEIEEDVLQVEDPSKKNALKNAFMKMQKNKLTNRVFLNKFIEQIA
jgi:hypothetical protein